MKSFEESLKEISKIVDQLESGDLSLDESIKKFEKGTKLIKDCYKELESVKKAVNIILEDSEGNRRLEVFNYEEDKDE